MRVIAIANHKGGVGKTTSVINLGAALARSGKRVCLIDLDAQMNLTQSFNVKWGWESVADRLLRPDEASYIPEKIKDSLWVLPADKQLASLETKTFTRNRNLLLKDLVVKPMEENRDLDFDYILLDTPPSLGLLTINAFTAANEVFIPMTAQPLSLSGARTLLDAIDNVREKANPALHLSGVFITMYDQRQTIQRRMADLISSTFKETMFQTRIGNNVTLIEATAARSDVFQYGEKSRGAKDYESLCQEVLKQEETMK